MTTPAIRDEAGRFRRGNSGNPTGRPRKREADRRIEELARNASEDAFNVVQDLMTSAETERTRLAAALAILERAHGKPGEVLADPVQVPEGATLAERAQAVADAAMAGAVSVSQASALLSCLASVARVREVEELEQRIAALEGQRNIP